MSNLNKNYTFYLFARPSFTEGIARVLDLGVTLQDYNTSETPEDADFEAIKKDWSAVGEDIKESINEYGRKSKQTNF